MTFPRSRILFALLLVTITGALVAPAASHAAKRPVLELKGKLIVGFKPETYEQALG